MSRVRVLVQIAPPEAAAREVILTAGDYDSLDMTPNTVAMIVEALGNDNPPLHWLAPATTRTLMRMLTKYAERARAAGGAPLTEEPR